MQSLWPEDQIDERGAPSDALAFLTRDAAANAELQRMLVERFQSGFVFCGSLRGRKCA